MKTRFAMRAAAVAAMFALCAGSALQAQEEGGRQRGQRGGGQRGGFGGGQRGGFGGFGTQRGGGSREMSKAQLLGIEEVRKELTIDGDQLETLNGTLEDYTSKQREIRRSAFEGMNMGNFREMSSEERAEMQKKMEAGQKKATEKNAKLDKETDELLGAVLNEKQWKRLGELQLQSRLRGGLMGAIADKAFAAKLKLTKEQLAKVDAIRKEGEKMRDEMRKMFSGGREGFDRDAFAEMREKGDDLRKKSEEMEKTLLTADQKKALATMKGKEFKFPERRRGGDRGGRGGRGGQGGDRGGRPSRPGGGGGERPARPGGGGGA